MSAPGPLVYDCLVLDLDGTLVNSSPGIVASVVYAFRQLDLTLDAAWVFARLGGPLQELWEGAEQDPSRYPLFEQSYRAHYELHGHGSTAAYPGVERTLRRLRGALPLIVATTKPTPSARRTLDSVGLLGYFDHVQGTDDLPHKPDPAVVLRAIEGYRRPTTSLLMVGDTYRDILAGRAAGAATCAVTYGTASRPSLEAHSPDHIIDHFSDLEAVIRG